VFETGTNIEKRGVRKSVVVCLAATVLFLSAGLVAYLIYRPDTHISQLIFKMFRFTVHTPENNAVTYFMKNWFSDICWAAALEFAVALILSGTKKSVLTSVLISLAFSALIEAAQKTGIIAGTFDWLDILSESLAIILSGMIIKIALKGETRNEKTT